MCAEVDLILIQTSILFFWRSLSILKKNFKKTSWTRVKKDIEGRHLHNRRIDQNRVNSSLISTSTSQGRKLDKQKGKILFTIEAGSVLCSSDYLNIPEITTYWSPHSVCTNQNSAISYVTKNDSAIFIPKMTHITLSSDNKVNLLKPFCRWVWRFFIQVIEMHGPYIL